MKKKKKLKRAAAFLSGAVILLTGTVAAFPMPVSAAGDCVIDTGTTYQSIRGFGGINHPEWAGDLTSAQRETAFGNGANQLGFTVLRVFVNPDKNQWNKAVPTAKYASEHDVTVFASPWEPPSSLAESGNGKGKLHLPSKNYGAYATHLNDFGNYMKQNGVNLYSISVQNEPDYAHDWTYWSTDEAMNFVADYGDKITSTKLMSPESFQFSPDGASWISGGDGGKRYYKKIMNNAKAMANCDVFGTHYYGTTRDWMDYPELENCGKELWMTEVYVPNSDNNSSDRFPEALAVAENIHNGMCVSNLSAYVWWYIRRQYGPMNENGTVSKRGAMMAQYSKWVRPGAVRIAATEFPEGKKYVAMDTKNGNYGQLQTMVSAYKQDNQITVVAINPTPSAKTQNFTISSGEKISGIEAYHTTGSENFRATSAPSYSDKSFSASLPAQSVTTFVVSTGEAEPDPDGYLFHYTFENGTDGFTGRGGASAETVSTDKYAGSKTLAVTGRESTWHGAAHTLSGSFKAGEAYSFSAVVKQNSSASEPMHFSIEYKDASGETQYDKIASGLAPKGEWVQLANTSYTIPAGASSIQFYFETDGDTGTTCDFYVDEVIGAPKGTEIDGPKAADLPDHPVVTPTGDSKPGDVNGDGIINAADLSLAKLVFSGKLTDSNAKRGADVDQNGTVEKEDIGYLLDYLLTKITKFPVAEKPVPQVDFTEMAQKFGSVNLAKCYKGENEHNPLITQYFGADPGVMEYNDRVYIYMTDDHLLYNNGQVTKETYSTINCLRCISSDDLVNWTDHGLINVAGQNGIAKWAGNSWAPTACHKKINGKEKFFLYFANNANGIGVLTSDSPTGPWSDPNGKAMIDRKTAGCTDVPWVFDPAVLVDDDGKGYLYFGGGTENKPSDHPKSARCVALSDSMTSIVGTPAVIDAPYMFEDSGIHKYNGKYYYSYCTNWSTGGNQYGLSTAAIDYMVSDSPLGPFTYKGEVFKNIGNFFGTTGNNHHTIMEFKGEWYLFYHAQYLQDVMNLKDMGYRSSHIDKITMNTDGTMQQVKGTKTGVSQIKALDPFTTVRAATFSHQGGLQIAGSGNSTVTAEKGDWFRVTGADCKSATSITVKASAQSGGIIKVCTGSASGTPVAYVEIPSGGSMQEIVAPVSGLSGKTDLYFVFNNNISMDSWKLS